ncbi:MAG: PAM68 family protein [Cyanobacteriota bacterium]|nr:PAM68 family protein [Cyanobacteriota bacterium]
MAAKGLGPQPPRPATGSRQRGKAQPASTSQPARKPQVIPEAIANRMARRIAVASGVPSVLGMAVFVVSYVLVSRHIVDVPPGLTLIGSGAFFLLGVLGLSYGVLSASWESEPGTVLGGEQIGLNISRLRQSLRALRSGGQQG